MVEMLQEEIQSLCNFSFLKIVKIEPTVAAGGQAAWMYGALVRLGRCPPQQTVSKFWILNHLPEVPGKRGLHKARG
jgi:hypothetical protein